MNEDENLRSVQMYRLPSDTQGVMPMDRRFQSAKDQPHDSVANIKRKRALGNIYDLVLLHDPADGCMLLDLRKGAEAELSKFPCQVHKKEYYANKI